MGEALERLVRQGLRSSTRACGRDTARRRRDRHGRLRRRAAAPRSAPSRSTARSASAAARCPGTARRAPAATRSATSAASSAAGRRPRRRRDLGPRRCGTCASRSARDGARRSSPAGCGSRRRSHRSSTTRNAILQADRPPSAASTSTRSGPCSRGAAWASAPRPRGRPTRGRSAGLRPAADRRRARARAAAGGATPQAVPASAVARVRVLARPTATVARSRGRGRVTFTVGCSNPLPGDRDHDRLAADRARRASADRHALARVTRRLPRAGRRTFGLSVCATTLRRLRAAADHVAAVTVTVAVRDGRGQTRSVARRRHRPRPLTARPPGA